MIRTLIGFGGEAEVLVKKLWRILQRAQETRLVVIGSSSVFNAARMRHLLLAIDFIL